MLATPGALPEGPEWLFEVKWDGMRLLAEVADGVLHLRTRSGRDVTASFPELADLVRLAPDVLLDGEVVLLDGGVPSFAALADRMLGPVDERAAHSRPAAFMAFDVLRLYGVPLVDRPLDERRATLARLALDSVSTLALSPSYADGQALFDATMAQGMEGVVAKRRDGVYRPGSHSPGWVTVTHRHTQVCLVGGWRPDGVGTTRVSNTRIGSLLLGVPGEGGLRYAGKVAAGPASDVAQQVLLQRLVRVERTPFSGPVPRPDSAGARWCEPLTVVEVSHRGWSADGRLREPVFRGVRDDLDPGQVHHER